MNEIDEQERLARWRELQIELGLAVDEPAAPAASVVPAPPVPPPPPPPVPVPPPAARVVNVEPEPLPFELPPESELIPETSDSGDGTENQVEVGEAPEELTDTDGPPDGDKKRRRRRRRRRKGGPEAAPTAAPGLASPAIADAATPETLAPPSDDTDLSEGDEYLDDGEAADDDDDDDDIEPISFSDIVVPSWQELIASLYRPER